MKTFIFALIGLLGVTLGAPLAEARDKDRDRRHHDSRDYPKHHSDHRHYYRSYPRGYTYRSYSYPRYYSYPRSYTYYRDPYYGERYYHSRRPALSFSFGL